MKKSAAIGNEPTLYVYQPTTRRKLLAIGSLLKPVPYWPAGSIAGLIGPVPTVLIGGAVAVAVSIGGAISCPQLRRLKRLTDAELEQTSGS
ncbi:MAG: hypothetical protein V7711_08360 [Pseudomonadales bacterium]